MGNYDALDYKILQQLYKDSSITNKNLATQLDIPPTTCLERVRRLREQGVLKQSHAEVNMLALGCNLQALITIRVNKHSQKDSEKFCAEMLRQPEVQTLYHVGGEFDFNMHIFVRDSDHLRDFVYSTLTSREDVTRIETSLVYEYWRNTILPTEAPLTKA